MVSSHLWFSALLFFCCCCCKALQYFPTDCALAQERGGVLFCTIMYPWVHKQGAETYYKCCRICLGLDWLEQHMAYRCPDGPSFKLPLCMLSWVLQLVSTFFLILPEFRCLSGMAWPLAPPGWAHRVSSSSVKRMWSWAVPRWAGQQTTGWRGSQPGPCRKCGSWSPIRSSWSGRSSRNSWSWVAQRLLSASRNFRYLCIWAASVHCVHRYWYVNTQKEMKAKASLTKIKEVFYLTYILKCILLGF